MWKKVYIALLAIGVLIGCFFVFYSWSWLQSIGDPRTAWEAYNYHRRSGTYFTLGWTAALVAVANVVLWTSRSAWALWASHAYFVVFAILLLVVLHLMGTNFCVENSVCDNPSRMVGVLLAAFGSLALGGILFLDQYVIIRLQEKMYPTAAAGVMKQKENSRDVDPES